MSVAEIEAAPSLFVDQILAVAQAEAAVDKVFREQAAHGGR